MALVEIFNVEQAKSISRGLTGSRLDRPAPGDTSESYVLELQGRIPAQNSGVQCVELLAGERVMRSIPLSTPRGGPVAMFWGKSSRFECGFQALVGAVGLDRTFDLDVCALHNNQTRTPLFRLQGRHCGIQSAFQPRIRPLVVTSLGRSGSTWLMRLLVEHPHIVAPQVYPYEIRAGRYWMQALQVLTEPTNALQSSTPDGLSPNQWWVGNHPFYRAPLTDHPELFRWFSKAYTEQAAAFCLQSTDGFYQQIAHAQGKNDAVYFAEKNQPDRAAALLCELCPDAREVFLVRDFRDMMCSIRAFNARRGRDDFGRSLVKDETEFLSLVSKRVNRFLRHWQSRAGPAHLVRYEDLIARPEETVSAMLAFLGLDAGTATLEQMICSAAADIAEFERHSTSSDPLTTVGRWKVDLNAEERVAMTTAFAEPLEAFGYPAE
ncbi:MAG: sulfotransferase [Tepidisphaeraceae bacterium]|jgi:hypothetical protein